jgi:enoyl-CoA hydratase/carnithine racemase
VTTTTVRLDHHGPVAVVALDRPDRLNAYTWQMGVELDRLLHELDADPDIRAIVLTGTGRAFCAGQDLADGAETWSRDRERSPEERAQDEARGTVAGVPREAAGVLTLAIARLTTPTIAAVNGAAVGIGATLPLAMDFRIASTTARFGYVFTRRGVAQEGASSWFLPRIVGAPTATDWLLTGRVLDAEEALRAGLVTALHAPDDLVPAAVTLGRQIADHCSPVALAASKRLLWASAGAATPYDAHRWESIVMHQLGSGPDAAEGVDSFLEKRPPAFATRVADLPAGVLPDVPDPADVEPA